MSVARVLTFAPMIDSETVRLLLRHYRVDYVEDDRLFGWVSLLTLFHGGYGRVPLVYGGGFTVSGPLALAQHCDAALDEPAKLLPTLAPLAATVMADWQTYNDGLGTDAAVFAYFHLMPERSLMAPIFAEPVPPGERRALRWAYPFLNALFTMGLRLSPQRARDAADGIRRAFDATDRRIADGRQHLCGDRLTLGDIALAAAAAPLLLPAGYGAKMPPVDATPAPMKLLIHELREHPTAAFVDRFYREQVLADDVTPPMESLRTTPAVRS